MPQHTIGFWSFSDITTTGPDPFGNTEITNGSAPGNSTFTINGGVSSSEVIVKDNDANYNDNDEGQKIAGEISFNTYSYVVRPQGSTDPADNVTIYVVGREEDDFIDGIMADGQLQDGVTYDIIAIDSNSASVAYSALFVCYAPGTLILTDAGDVPVEDLRVGDRLVTLDRSAQPIRWIGHRRLTFPEGPHKQKPIEIKAGALGGGPEHRLIVSPQHRMLIDGSVVEEMFGRSEVLALAKGLVGLDHVRAMNGKREVTYYSLLCDRHEVIRANGAWSESFYPGPTALEMIGPRMRRQVETLFPAVTSDPEGGYGNRARRCLTRAETEDLVEALLARGFNREDDETARRKRNTEFRKWDEDLAGEKATTAPPKLRLVT